MHAQNPNTIDRKSYPSHDFDGNRSDNLRHASLINFTYKAVHDWDHLVVITIGVFFQASS